MHFDWLDIALHVVAAVFVVWLLSLVFDGWCVAGANMAFWAAREWAQDVRKGHDPAWPMRRSTQKDWEFGAPAFAGMLVVWIGD